MKKDLLEQIIRQVLNEGKIRISIETLRTADETVMDSLHDDLGITYKLSNEKNKFAAADGFLIKIKRVGGRSEDESGKKSYELDAIALRAKAIQQIDTLSGAYAPMKSSEYTWFISPNINENPRDIKKSKDTRVIATYIIQAFYVKSSLLWKLVTPQDHPSGGYITTTASNGLIYDKSKIVRSQWRREVKSGADVPMTLPFDLGVPQKEMKFGQKEVISVKLLFLYFSENLTSILPASDAAKLQEELEQESTFGDFHKAFVEAFQKEQNLPITGDYDTATLQRALQLNKESYTFANTDDLKTRLMLIINTKKEQEQQISSIQVPAEGFKFNVTTKNAEFYKVQLAMIKFCKDIGVPSWPINSGNAVQDDNSKKAILAVSDFETALQNTVQQGTYGKKTQAVVKLCKLIIMKILPEEQQIKLLNSTADLVDQQFVNAIITTKI